MYDDYVILCLVCIRYATHKDTLHIY